MTKQSKQSTEAAVRDIRRRTRRKFSPEEKIRIVLEGLRGEQSVSDLCRREGIASNLYYRWSKDFLEAGKKQLAGDTVREATSDEVKELRAENSELKEVVAEITLKNRPLDDLRAWLRKRVETERASGFEARTGGRARAAATHRGHERPQEASRQGGHVVNEDLEPTAIELADHPHDLAGRRRHHGGTHRNREVRSVVAVVGQIPSAVVEDLGPAHGPAVFDGV